MIARGRYVVMMVAVLLPGIAAAQTPSLLRHLELSGGIGVLGGATLGTQNADLRTATTGQPYRLFTSNSRMSAAPVIDLRLGTALTRRFGVEAHASFGHPEVRTALSSDAEGAPSITAVERLDQYVIDGGVVYRLTDSRVAGVVPFAAAGGGYLRQLHEGLSATDSGRVVYAGGGVRREFVVRPRGFVRTVGARGDVRLNMLSGGIEVEDRTRRHVSASGSVYFVF